MARKMHPGKIKRKKENWKLSLIKWLSYRIYQLKSCYEKFWELYEKNKLFISGNRNLHSYYIAITMIGAIQSFFDVFKGEYDEFKRRQEIKEKRKKAKRKIK